MLATALDACPEFAGEIAKLARLGEGKRYEVKTQEREPETPTRGSCTIDLQVQALGEDDVRLWLLWSEHKVNDVLTQEQLEKELDALRCRAGGQESRLIAITLYPPSAEVRAYAHDHGIRLKRWRDIREAATTALAATREERARQLIQEWLSYSTHRLESQVEPLNVVRTIDILNDAKIATATLRHLAEQGMAHAAERLGSVPPRWKDEWWQTPVPDGSWLADYGVILTGGLVINEPWVIEAERPAIAAGGWSYGDDARTLRQPKLRETFRDRDFASDDNPDRRNEWMGFAKVLPLSRLSDNDLAAQEEEVGRFFQHTFEKLLSPMA